MVSFHPALLPVDQASSGLKPSCVLPSRPHRPPSPPVDPVPLQGHRHFLLQPQSKSGQAFPGGAVQETQVPSLGQEDPLQEAMPTPGFLPGESHGQRSLGGLQSTLSPSDVRLLVTPWTVAQEYWTGLPLPPPGDLPDPRMQPASSASPALQAATRW